MQRGFLPTLNPLTSLPEKTELNRRLNQLTSLLPLLLKRRTLRAEVDALNKNFSLATVLIDLNDPQQRAILRLQLHMLAQAYIWENPEKPMSKIPAVLGKNMYLLAEYEQSLPVLTYGDYVLQNWKTLDPRKGITLENIEPLVTFTGIKDEAWFIKIHIVIEHICSQALDAAQQACNLANLWFFMESHDGNSNNENRLIGHLNTISLCLHEAIKILKRMNEHCDPDFFWNGFRPYLSGWENVVTNINGQTIKGINFEGLGSEQASMVYAFKGSSGAQSGIIPAMDAVLGIKHKIDGVFQHFQLLQQYLPSEHQAFIKLLGLSKIKQLVEKVHSVPLTRAFEAAVAQVNHFRTAHLGLVHQYVYKPAQKQGIKRENIAGTGGTSADVFLVERLAAGIRTVEEKTYHRARL